MKAIQVILIALVAVCASAKVSFDGYRLIRLTPETLDQVKLLADLENSIDFDVWNNGRGLRSNVDVALSPEAYEKYKEIFRASNIKYSIIQHNIENIINEEQRSMTRTSRNNIVGTFAKYADIVSYMDNMADTYPDLVSTNDIGRTYENRLLKTLVIKTASAKRRIWIDCGIHAREWISPATCIYMIDRFITEYNAKDPVTLRVLNQYEIHFMPLVNPDGYDYTWSTSRLWRKNRTPNIGSTCIGVDLNRNYGFQWMTGGSSNNPCSDIFAGPFGDSELETQAMETEILKYKGTWDSYLTIHTYGLWWFLPWGYSTATIPDYKDLEDKAKIAAAAIKRVNGLDFVIGSSAQLLYVNSGPSDDWARGAAGINYSYTLELRPGQTGTDSEYGFILPEDRAPLAGAETWAGIKAYLNSLF